MACEYVSIDAARAMTGLRVALTGGVPGAWSVAIKAILDFKRLEYVTVAQNPGGINDELKAWTGQTSAPVLMFDDHLPRTNWSEMLVLAEQLQPEPRLIPLEEEERMAMFGLCHEICGEDGLGWNIRLLLMLDKNAPRNEIMIAKYRSPVTQGHARQRAGEVIAALARRLHIQAERGSRYFLTGQLTAADIYWCAFSNMFNAMSEDLCVMPDFYRTLGPIAQSHLNEPLPQILLDHRDYIARHYFQLPIDL